MKKIIFALLMSALAFSANAQEKLIAQHNFITYEGKTFDVKYDTLVSKDLAIQYLKDEVARQRPGYPPNTRIIINAHSGVPTYNMVGAYVDSEGKLVIGTETADNFTYNVCVVTISRQKFGNTTILNKEMASK